MLLVAFLFLVVWAVVLLGQYIYIYKAVVTCSLSLSFSVTAVQQTDLTHTLACYSRRSGQPPSARVRTHFPTLVLFYHIVETEKMFIFSMLTFAGH